MTEKFVVVKKQLPPKNLKMPKRRKNPKTKRREKPKTNRRRKAKTERLNK